MVKKFVAAFLLTVLLSLMLMFPVVSSGASTPTNNSGTNLVTLAEPPSLLQDAATLVLRISITDWGIIFSGLSTIVFGFYRYGWKPLHKVYKQLTKIIDDHDDLSRKINRLFVEMTPNGGSSLCDSVRRMEIGIAKVETRHRAFLDSLRVIRFEADEVGGCLWVSEAYCELTGTTSTNALGTGWTNILHPDDKELVLKEWSAAVSGKRDFIQTYRLINLYDQSEHKVRCHASPLLNPRTKLVEGFVGTLYPISGEFFEKYKNKGYIW